MLKPDSVKLAKISLLAGSLLLSLSFVALFPPFEGADEAAHYSYVEQMS
jgi:hypothetical protein